MPGFDGTGPMGMGPMTGGGRGFCAVPLRTAWPSYATRGFSAPYNAPWGIPFSGAPSFAPAIARGEELEYMKDLYYEAKGWTKEGLIPKEKLEALGMDDVAEEIGV